MSTAAKYLSRYIEPESELAARLPEGYAAVLAVPALGESIELLEGYRQAARAAPGRVLIVLVVNAALATPSALREENARLIQSMAAGAAGTCSTLGPGALRISSDDFDVLLVDRSSSGRELPPKRGVGLARKIALDIAFRAQLLGRAQSPWLSTTDADVTLPEDYFRRIAATPLDATALLHPFVHEGASDEVALATARYELFLRYHVLGLAWAGSPYAYTSLGSAMSVNAQAYASVRGVPQREAGEDFYLLAKLAKLGPLQRSRGAPVRVRARLSARVPFGTGPRVSAILRNGELAAAPPEAYAVLGGVLSALEAFATHRHEPRLQADLADAGALSAAEIPMVRIAAGAGLLNACRDSAAQVGAGDLRRRLHTWFDGLRTLRLLHAVRDAGVPDVPLSAAIARAPFAAQAAHQTVHEQGERLRALEEALPERIGPTLSRLP